MDLLELRVLSNEEYCWSSEFRRRVEQVYSVIVVARAAVAWSQAYSVIVVARAAVAWSQCVSFLQLRAGFWLCGARPSVSRASFV
jgi:hypothetical protein